MKDIYELLNDIEISESDFKELNVTEFEKDELKGFLNEMIKKEISKPRIIKIEGDKEIKK
ncbi:TPA: hypothetical protein QCX46_004307 [Bacillus toyonensis]|nr:hypothetical protein [Bacillus toyonensis]HDR7471279.1 hypothetical protein [Bacillus toyonensis]